MFHRFLAQRCIHIESITKKFSRENRIKLILETLFCSLFAKSNQFPEETLIHTDQFLLHSENFYFRELNYYKFDTAEDVEYLIKVKYCRLF